MQQSTTIPLSQVSHIATLAHLPITEEQKELFSKQLSAILVFVSKLQTVDTTSVVPTSQVTGLENVFREDVVAPSFTQEEALANAPRQHNGFFVVDAVFE